VIATPFRGLLCAAAIALAPPAAAQGLDLSDMSAAERDAFRAEVRAFLVENPEVIVEALEVFEQRRAEQATERDRMMVQALAADLTDPATSWIGGNPDGDVTVIEFMDYRCGYCRRAHPEIEDLIASDGDIRYVLKEFPILGDQSMLAARFAIAARMVAGDDAYKRVHDALMTLEGDINELSLELMAEEIGLDAAAISARMGDAEVTDVIRANRVLAQELQINGTPSFVFGSEMVRGYVPLEAMRQIVAELRREG
jgi:protein-disulfide isomerase